MKTLSITNPKTNRTNRLRAWEIQPREVLAKFRSKEYKSAKDLSWDLLSHQNSMDAAHEEQGEDRASNWGLSILENALDWTLGLAVVNYINSAVKVGKLPKPFHVGCNRTGDVFIVTSSGRILG